MSILKLYFAVELKLVLNSSITHRRIIRTSQGRKSLAEDAQQSYQHQHSDKSSRPRRHRPFVPLFSREHCAFAEPGPFCSGALCTGNGDNLQMDLARDTFTPKYQILQVAQTLLSRTILRILSTGNNGISRSIIPFGGKIRKGDIYLMEDIHGRVKIGLVAISKTSAGYMHGSEAHTVSIVRLRGSHSDQQSLTRRDVGKDASPRFHGNETRCLQERDVDYFPIKYANPIRNRNGA